MTHLRGKYFHQLSDDEKTRFWTYDFSVEYLPTNEEGLINDIFQRINKNTAKLTAQELRHARFNGIFVTAAEDLTAAMNKVLPENFPRIESQSRKQMKDVELVANLLLLLEGFASVTDKELTNSSDKDELSAVRGYSQDELDAAFSERDTDWEYSTEITATFNDIIKSVNDIVMRPENSAWPLHKTRLRNQADFYSLFGAVAAMPNSGVLTDSSAILADRLATFTEIVEDENQREGDKRATEYFTAARSNSNDTGSRRTRVRIIRDILKSDSE